jgi:uncharacterized protein YjgD (DUF1641 family)
MPPTGLMDTIASSTPQEQLQARLADPRTVDSLNRLLDHLDAISASVEMLDGFLRRGDEIADNVAESVHEFRGQGEAAAGFVEKLPNLAKAGTKMADVANSAAFGRLLESGLLERLAEPGTIEGLTNLIDKLPLLSFAADSLDGFLRRGDEIADSAAESMNDLKKLTAHVNMEQLIQVADELPQLTTAGQQLIKSGLLNKVSELTEAGMSLSKAGFFEPKTVQTLAEMGRAAAESYDSAKAVPQKRYGIFDLLRLLRDPAIQKTVNILVESSRRFGSKLNA